MRASASNTNKPTGRASSPSGRSGGEGCHGQEGKHEEHENLERWLVSYADFITLLFTFFVMMYAISR
jgi:Flagellar motor protein